jgi:hypothetical protein
MRSLRGFMAPIMSVLGKCVAGGGVRGYGDDVGNGRRNVDGMMWYGGALQWMRWWWRCLVVVVIS